MAMNFSIELADPKVVSDKKKVDDTRSLASRMFTKLNPETGEVEPFPIKVVNTGHQTAAEQGLDAFALAGQIPVYLAYKQFVNDFKGATKGRDSVLIGRRPGRGGSAGIMLMIDEIPEFVQHLTDLHKALSEAVPELRKQAGIPEYKPAGSATAAKPAAAAKKVDLDNDDELPH